MKKQTLFKNKEVVEFFESLTEAVDLSRPDSYRQFRIKEAKKILGNWKKRLKEITK